MFLEGLTEEIKTRFESILIEPSLFGFGKDSKIQVSATEEQAGNSLSLCLGTLKFKNTDRSTFKVKLNDKDYLSFRNPQLMEFEFSIISKSATAAQKLQYFECLQNDFFESKTIEAYFPKNFHDYPELVKKMQQMRAEIIPLNKDHEQASFYFSFLYRGPFHSGKPLEGGQLVQSKVIEYNQNKVERRTL